MQAEHDRWLTGVIAAGLRESGVPALAANADALAVLQIAAADGLAMQMLSDPSGFDPQPSLTILGRLIRHHVPGDASRPAGATLGAG